MKLRLRRPRDLATRLVALAQRRPEEVEEYLEDHLEEWSALAEAIPGDAADILEAIDEETAGELVADLEPEDAAGVLGELRDALAAEILLEMPAESAAELLEEMSPEDAVDILAELEAEDVEPLLALMSAAAQAEIRRLLTYSPDSAGGLMTTDIAALPIGLTTGEAIERLRLLHEELEDLSYVYVVDDEHRLEGVLSFRELVFHRPGVGLDEAMVANPISVGVDTDREEVADLARRYHLFGLPVVDHFGRLVGMVTTEAVIETVHQEASEDFAASVGGGIGETIHTEIAKSVRLRLPWLLLNLVLALLVASAVEGQTGIITAEPVLAALMPVVAQLGGNAGSQSLVVVIRGLAFDDVPSSRVWRTVGRQGLIGFLKGLVVSVAAGSAAYLLTSTGVFFSAAAPDKVALVVSIAALTNLTVGATVGTAIPFMLRRLGLDPALASSIFLTLCTDAVGFGGFLLMASALL